MKKSRLIICLALIVALSAILLTGCNFSAFIDDGTLGHITDNGDISDLNNGKGGNGNILSGTLAGATNLANIVLQTTTGDASDNRILPDVIEDIEDSVVVINVTVADGTSAGSGVIVASSTSEGHSYIMTCLHVVEGYTKIEVTLNNNNKYVADFVGGVPDNDIALLRIKVTQNIVVAQIRDVVAKPIRTAEDAIAIGNPLGTLGGTVTKGIISATKRELNIEGSVMTLLQTDASINSGNSGGGLFDSKGLLIGIVNAKSVGNNVEGLGYAIPIEIASDLSQKLLDTRGNSQYNGLGYITGKKMLGITTQSGTFSLGSGNVYASQVTQMNLYGSAASSGLSVDDYITKADGVALSESRSLGAVLAGKAIGDTLQLTVLRRESYTQGWTTQYRYNEHNINITLKQYVYGYEG